MIFNAIRNKIRLFSIKKKEPYLSLYNILGFYPNNINLYEQAFIHRSLAVRQRGKSTNNERLEFLGDAVLSAIVGDIVYRHFADKKEGFLTSTRAKIVQRESLNQYAINLGIDKFVSSMPYVATHHKFMYGNALEALIGAIYLDKGYKVCYEFIEKRIIKDVNILDKVARQEVNFKSHLLEWGQKNRVQIDFNLIEEIFDENNSPIFRTSVAVKDTELAVGCGSTKKESQQAAAEKALNRIHKDKDILQLIEDLRENK